MAAKRFWRVVRPVALSALLAATGCSSSESNGNGDAGSDGGDAGQAVGDLEDNVAGKACTSNDDCSGEGARCTDSFELGGEIGSLVGLGQQAPGGYCTATCTDDSQCGKGGVCADAVNALGLEGQCEKACKKDDDCRNGYVCTSLTMALEDIDIDELVGDAGVDVPDGGIPPQALSCKPAPDHATLRDDVAGAACEADDDCKGQGTECLQTIGSIAGFGGIEAPGGYCSGDCSEDAHCGKGGVCLRPPLPLVPGACLAGCETDDDCEREGYRCQELGQAGSVCLPGESLDDGVAGTACESDDDCGQDGTCASAAAGSSFTPDGGFCTLAGCFSDDDCGAGGVCQVTLDAEGAPSASTCAEGCDVAAQDCSRENYACVSQDEASAALQDAPLSDYCQLQAPCDPACGDAEVCDDGTCVAAP